MDQPVERVDIHIHGRTGSRKYIRFCKMFIYLTSNRLPACTHVWWPCVWHASDAQRAKQSGGQFCLCNSNCFAILSANYGVSHASFGKQMRNVAGGLSTNRFSKTSMKIIIIINFGAVFLRAEINNFHALQATCWWTNKNNNNMTNLQSASGANKTSEVRFTCTVKVKPINCKKVRMCPQPVSQSSSYELLPHAA